MRKRFGSILLAAGVVDRAVLGEALEKQRCTNQRLGQVLEEMGVATEQQIAAALGRQFGIKTVTNLAKACIPSDVLGRVSKDFALRKWVVPIEEDNGVLSLAMVDPLDIDTMNRLSFETGLRIIPFVTTPAEIEAAVNRHYLGLPDLSEQNDPE